MWKKLLLAILRFLIPIVLDEIDKDPKIPLVKSHVTIDEAP